MDELKKSLRERHAAGQKEYGAFSFLGKNMKEEVKEELVDAVNYLIYEGLKNAKPERLANLSEEDFNALHSRTVEELSPQSVKKMLLPLIEDLCE